MARILVVEDDLAINAMISELLTDRGHTSVSVHDGVEASDAVRGQSFDLVVLDLMLPRISGAEVLRKIRSQSSTPVLVVSAKDAVWNKIDLLEQGADDYITKPFDLGELAARVDALIRRTQVTHEPREMTRGPIRVNPATKRAWVGEDELHLTATEFAILELLLEAGERVLSKQAIYEQAWGEPYMGDDSTVKTHISRVRTKLRESDPAADLIETVWGLGYRMRAV